MDTTPVSCENTVMCTAVLRHRHNLLGGRREAQRQTNDEMRATLMDSLGRYGASGEWDPSSSPSSSVDAQTGSSSGAASSSANGEQPAWTQGILERWEMHRLVQCYMGYCEM